MAKIWIAKSMMNSRGFFFFKFDGKDGVEQVLRDGQWLIRNSPLFLKPWSSTTELNKEELKKIQVWGMSPYRLILMMA